jgi:hypothetical protein
MCQKLQQWSLSGGFAFFETSQLPNVVDASNTVSAMIISPTLESTGSKGFCINLRYVPDGVTWSRFFVQFYPNSCRRKWEFSAEKF